MRYIRTDIVADTIIIDKVIVFIVNTHGGGVTHLTNHVEVRMLEAPDGLKAQLKRVERIVLTFPSLSYIERKVKLGVCTLFENYSKCRI